MTRHASAESSSWHFTPLVTTCPADTLPLTALHGRHTAIEALDGRQCALTAARTGCWRLHAPHSTPDNTGPPTTLLCSAEHVFRPTGRTVLIDHALPRVNMRTDVVWLGPYIGGSFRFLRRIILFEERTLPFTLLPFLFRHTLDKSGKSVYG